MAAQFQAGGPWGGTGRGREGFVACLPSEARGCGDKRGRGEEAREQEEREKIEAAREAVRQEAEALLAAAREEAEARVRQAEEEAQAVLREALAGLVEALHLGVRAYLQECEEELPELVGELVERIVGRREEGAVLEVIEQALEEVRGARRVELVVNLADVAQVREAEEKLLAGLEGAELAVTGSERVERGGVVVRTERGEVDAQIRVQLERLRERLEEAA